AVALAERACDGVLAQAPPVDIGPLTAKRVIRAARTLISTGTVWGRRVVLLFNENPTIPGIWHSAQRQLGAWGVATHGLILRNLSLVRGPFQSHLLQLLRRASG